MEPDVIGELLRRCERDHKAWINGDAAGYSLPEDGTILGGVGGYSYGGTGTAERQAAVAAEWEWGDGEIELLSASADAGLAYLTFIERARVRFRSEEAERRWNLRVTEVFALRAGAWVRVHRHADPLVARIPLDEAVALIPQDDS